jgi:myo-inositol-1(or 4)-monophosphatase
LPSNEGLVTLAERAARAAGELVRNGRREGLTVSATKSSPTDIVTEMDTAAESLLARTLLAERPHDGLLGEEGGLRPGTSGLTWVVDPIDGTVNYLYGIPAYAVSVAVVTGEPDPQTWTVLAGCVHNPETGETWTAARGGGARLDGRPVPGPAQVAMGQALVGTGFGYTVERRRRQAQVVATLLPRVRDVRRFGAASLDLAHVASGRYDGFGESGLQPWDVAAGLLMVREAGGFVSDFRGGDQPIERKEVIAGNDAIHSKLHKLVAGALR